MNDKTAVTMPGPMGWVPDVGTGRKNEYKRCVEWLYQDRPYTTYAQAMSLAGLPLITEEWQDVALWELEARLLGSVLPAHYQRIGSCVGQGWTKALEDQILVDIASGEREMWPGKLAVAFIYAFSRCEVGGGRLGNEDGSLGVWAAEAAAKHGVLPRKFEGLKYDLSGDDSMCKEWGGRREGVPSELEPQAAIHVGQNIAMIKTAEEIVSAGQAWRSIPVCSNRGFTMTRDKYGMCSPKGSWNHCMLWRGVLKIKHPQHPGGRVVIPNQQSWGPSPDGPTRVTLQSGREIELAEGVFLIDIEVGAKMASQEDTHVVDGVRGWDRPKLDFLLG